MSLYEQHMKHCSNHRKDKFYQQCSGYSSFGRTYDKMCCNNCMNKECTERSEIFGNENKWCDHHIGIDKNVIYV